jgi:hypothetical protein
VRELSGSVLLWVSVPAAVALAVGAIRGTRSASLLVPLSLFAGAALPYYAFYEGHPFRVRYMIPTVAVCALFAGLAVGKIEQLTRGAPRLGLLPTAVAAFLIVAGIVKSSPLSQRTPILEEATADAPASLGRQVVTTCLRQQYHGEKVLVSMGALAHYMQELSLAGFDLSEFVHEGNGSTWLTALDAGPAPRIGWMLTEEQSRGGDLLAQRVRADPTFTRGMTRICEGGGVALYRRD